MLLLHTCVAAVASDEAEAEGAAAGGEGSKVEVVDELIPEPFVEDVLGPASGVETVVFFPNNPSKSVVAGEPSEIVLGISNNGGSPLKVAIVRAHLNLPYDHRINVQNFTAQDLNTTVPAKVQASFSYSFTIHKYLQPGTFDLVGSVFYELDNQLYKSVFYNGTVEVVEPSGFVSGETMFLVTLGLGLLGLLGMWAYAQVQKFSKKQRRTTKKVETGTRPGADAASNEWLQGTSITQKLSRSVSQQRKAQKKK